VTAYADAIAKPPRALTELKQLQLGGLPGRLDESQDTPAIFGGRV
jgi:hypothetical protein